jgi:hypothetical protein
MYWNLFFYSFNSKEYFYLRFLKDEIDHRLYSRDYFPYKFTIFGNDQYVALIDDTKVQIWEIRNQSMKGIFHFENLGCSVPSESDVFGIFKFPQVFISPNCDLVAIVSDLEENWACLWEMNLKTNRFKLIKK